MKTIVVKKENLVEININLLTLMILKLKNQNNLVSHNEVSHL